MGREFKLPRGINNPVVEYLPQGDKNSGVTPKGDRVPGEDGQGQVRDGKYPATRDTEDSRDSRSGEEMESGLGPAAPQRL